MTARLWCWSDIVSPQAVEAAMADEERRARHKRLASNDLATGDDGRRPVAA
jgi:hypothetical protein